MENVQSVENPVAHHTPPMAPACFQPLMAARCAAAAWKLVAELVTRCQPGVLWAVRRIINRNERLHPVFEAEDYWVRVRFRRTYEAHDGDLRVVVDETNVYRRLANGDPIPSRSASYRA